MIIVSLAWYWWGDWCDGEPEGDAPVDDIGYVCRFFIPKTTDIKVANALANNYSIAEANANGEGSYETKNFFEIELTK